MAYDEIDNNLTYPTMDPFKLISNEDVLSRQRIGRFNLIKIAHDDAFNSISSLNITFDGPFHSLVIQTSENRIHRK